jgi:hypothetical protein
LDKIVAFIFGDTQDFFNGGTPRIHMSPTVFAEIAGALQ